MPPQIFRKDVEYGKNITYMRPLWDKIRTLWPLWTNFRAVEEYFLRGELPRCVEGSQFI